MDRANLVIKILIASPIALFLTSIPAAVLYYYFPNRILALAYWLACAIGFITAFVRME